MRGNTVGMGGVQQKDIVVPEVTFFHRKPRLAGNYSIEFIFRDVVRRLGANIRPRLAVASFESAGFFRRAYLCVEAAFRQHGVNHVTGDINFVGLLLPGKRTVQTIHDCAHLERTKGLRHALIKLIWVTLPVRRCAYVTTVSEATRRELMKYVPSCDPGKIVVIPVAISERYRRREKPFNKMQPRILQVGTAPNKNIMRLAEALRGMNCTLEVVGRLSDKQRAALSRNGIAYTNFWGLSDEEMVKRYEDSDIVALVSTYEGFGMPILEGQATGRPVITSQVLSMPEVAGSAACLVDPYDVASIREGVLRIVEEDEYREALVHKGLENVKRFDAHRIAMQYLDLYRRLAVQ